MTKNKDYLNIFSSENEEKQKSSDDEIFGIKNNKDSKKKQIEKFDNKHRIVLITAKSIIIDFNGNNKELIGQVFGKKIGDFISIDEVK